MLLNLARKLLIVPYPTPSPQAKKLNGGVFGGGDIDTKQRSSIDKYKVQVCILSVEPDK